VKECQCVCFFNILGNDPRNKMLFPIPHVEGNVAAVAVSTRAEDTFVYGESSFVIGCAFAYSLRSA